MRIYVRIIGGTKYVHNHCLLDLINKTIYTNRHINKIDDLNKKNKQIGHKFMCDIKLEKILESFICNQDNEL